MNYSSGGSRAGGKGGKREELSERKWETEKGRGDEEIDGGRGRVNEGEDVKPVVETKGRIGELEDRAWRGRHIWKAHTSVCVLRGPDQTE